MQQIRKPDHSVVERGQGNSVSIEVSTFSRSWSVFLVLLVSNYKVQLIVSLAPYSVGSRRAMDGEDVPGEGVQRRALRFRYSFTRRLCQSHA
jgi:hypothetical protein